MKTKQVLISAFILGSVLTMSAQDQVSNSILTSGGIDAGTKGDKSAYYGVASGQYCHPESTGNSFFGFGTGNITNLGSQNVFVGFKAGFDNVDGGHNVFVGANAGISSKDGNENVMIGHSAGDKHTKGFANVFLGDHSGAQGPETSQENTYIGYFSGYNCKGNGNIFLGNNAGSNIDVDNQLFITTGDNVSPLIWGNFKDDLIKLNGKVGTGGLLNFPTTAGTADVSYYSIYALGGILTEELRIATSSDWADYVFKSDYNLMPLDKVESFIKENGHLPNVPSAAEIKRNGMDVAKITIIQQEKIEELTLHLIEQQKQIEELKALVQQLADKK